MMTFHRYDFHRFHELGIGRRNQRDFSARMLEIKAATERRIGSARLRRAGCSPQSVLYRVGKRP
jgi:hypothetical protein